MSLQHIDLQDMAQMIAQRCSLPSQEANPNSTSEMVLGTTYIPVQPVQYREEYINNRLHEIPDAELVYRSMYKIRRIDEMLGELVIGK